MDFEIEMAYFQLTVFERYQRSEEALVLSIAVCICFSCFSMHKVDTIMEELCGMSTSKSQVRELAATT